MAQTEVYKILIIADSRGEDLRKHIDTQLATMPLSTPVMTELVHRGGTKLEDLDKLVENAANGQELYDFIHMLAGINNLTKKHISRRVTAVYDDVDHLVDQMTSKFYHVRQRMFKFTYRPIICQLVGMSLDMYNEDLFVCLFVGLV